MSKLVTLKTISGDEIIGKLVDSSSDEYEVGIIKLEEPFAIILTQQGAALMPVLIAAKTKQVPFFMNALLTPPVETNSEIEEAYIRQTSGLVFK